MQGRQSINQRARVAKPASRQPIGVREMATQIVMDRTGDTRHTFDIQDRAEVEKAERRFRELTGAGFTAAVRSGPGEQRVIRSFDPTAEETLFYPRLVGG
jgi:Cdc6-like AAA superfamily ATPase